jgi:hypothetical protein
MKATVQISNGKKVAVPELTSDFFFGVCRPNQDFINKEGIQFDDSIDVTELKEDQIIEGTITFKNTWLYSQYETYYKAAKL